MLKERIFGCHRVWPLGYLTISTQVGLDGWMSPSVPHSLFQHLYSC
uniref:Uncharacterized protein n=1 Tax=Moniliophthora roreri TaxID=221103 RepID=A0A0W0GBK0_MONRR